jgi:hypothetical protein
MELHASREQPEIRRHGEGQIDLGESADWPYAGARVLEADYADNGLSAIREWIRKLRDDPIGCRVEFDGFIAEFGADGSDRNDGKS